MLIKDKKKADALKFLPKLNSELMKIAKTGVIKKQNALLEILAARLPQQNSRDK